MKVEVMFRDVSNDIPLDMVISGKNWEEINDKIRQTIVDAEGSVDFVGLTELG